MTGKLENIRARPHPYGNRIIISWENPEPDLYPGVTLVRQQGTHPVSPDGGDWRIHRQALLPWTIDKGGLEGPDAKLTLFQIFQRYRISLSNRVELKVVEPRRKWRLSDHRFDFLLLAEGQVIRVFRVKCVVADANLKGETVYYYSLYPFQGRVRDRRYITNRANRIAAMATGSYDMAGQMYELLPRIYHRYDTVRSDRVRPKQDGKKGELRRFLDLVGGEFDLFYSYARAALDLHDFIRVDGRLLPLLAEWIGWNTDYRREIDQQRQEIREAPAVYKRIGLVPTVEAAVKRISGWESRTKEFVHNVFLTNSPERLNIWETTREGSNPWSKPTEPLSLDYAYEGRPAVAQDQEGKTWLFYHTYRKPCFEPGTVCAIWYKTLDKSGWSPSRSLVDRAGIAKYPAAALHGSKLWVFWSVFEEESQAWKLEGMAQSGDIWSEINIFGLERNPPERQRPMALADRACGLWLFWLEKNGQGQWRIKYNRHDGKAWETAKAIKILQDKDIEEPFVLFQPILKRLYLFWARRGPDGNRTLAYICKKSLDFSVSDWSKVQTLDGDFNDREPAAISLESKIDLYWSSNRAGNWLVWRRSLEPKMEKDAWGPAEAITSGPYSHRDPLPIAEAGKIRVIYRANQCVTYRSKIYTSTETIDWRYSGSSSFDLRNKAKTDLMGQFDDFQTYTYDTGKNNDDWYARDTAGMFLTVGTGYEDIVSKNQDIIKQFLGEIMPAAIRPVFKYDIIRPDIWEDKYTGGKDVHKDKIPEWIRLRTAETEPGVEPNYKDHRSVDFEQQPPDTKYRTWHTGLERELEED